MDNDEFIRGYRKALNDYRGLFIDLRVEVKSLLESIDKLELKIIDILDKELWP